MPLSSIYLCTVWKTSIQTWQWLNHITDHSKYAVVILVCLHHAYCLTIIRQPQEENNVFIVVNVKNKNQKNKIVSILHLFLLTGLGRAEKTCSLFSSQMDFFLMIVTSKCKTCTFEWVLKKKNPLVTLYKLKLSWQLSDSEYLRAPNFPPAEGPGREWISRPLHRCRLDSGSSRLLTSTPTLLWQRNLASRFISKLISGKEKGHTRWDLCTCATGRVLC